MIFIPDVDPRDYTFVFESEATLDQSNGFLFGLGSGTFPNNVNITTFKAKQVTVGYFAIEIFRGLTTSPTNLNTIIYWYKLRYKSYFEGPDPNAVDPYPVVYDSGWVTVPKDTWESLTVQLEYKELEYVSLPCDPNEGVSHKISVDETILKLNNVIKFHRTTPVVNREFTGDIGGGNPQSTFDFSGTPLVNRSDGFVQWGYFGGPFGRTVMGYQSPTTGLPGESFSGHLYYNTADTFYWSSVDSATQLDLKIPEFESWPSPTDPSLIDCAACSISPLVECNDGGFLDGTLLVSSTRLFRETNHRIDQSVSVTTTGFPPQRAYIWTGENLAQISRLYGQIKKWQGGSTVPTYGGEPYEEQLKVDCRCQSLIFPPEFEIQTIAGNTNPYVNAIGISLQEKSDIKQTPTAHSKYCGRMDEKTILTNPGVPCESVNGIGVIVHDPYSNEYYHAFVDDGDIYVEKSRWSAPVFGFEYVTRVTTDGINSLPAIEVHRNGIVWLLYYNGTNVVYRRSSDQAKSFTGATTMFTGMQDPRVECGMDGSLLFAASKYISGSSGPKNIYVIPVSPGEDTFPAAVKAKDETGADIEIEDEGFDISFSYDQQGRFLLVCKKDGETSSSHMASADHGLTWTTII